MADTKISALSAASAPASADLVALVQGGVSKQASVGQLAAYPGMGGLYNAATTATAAGFASDTYLAGSAISVPATLQQFSIYRCMFYATKTAAGTATPILTLRYGVNATTADTARCVLTFTAQTGAIDTGMFETTFIFVNVGSGTAASIKGIGKISHSLAATGFANVNNGLTTNTGGGFDSTVANSKIGMSVNGGTSAAWTIQMVQAELRNVA